MDCIFCKIVKGEIPSSKVYEDEKILAFLDIGPINKGHTLVIPKEHYEMLLDVPDGLLKEVTVAAKKIAANMKEKLNLEGFNIMQSNGKVAGQLVPHFHLHVIPRLADDGLKHWPGKKYEEGEMGEYKEKLKI
ncbi:HIT family protein [Candidatus Woesearchaeota archaeon]|nr:HIT family protein [Candidatus Woesearchaeota archaeon]